jgi:hypothetical protein
MDVYVHVHVAHGSKMLRHAGEVKSRFMACNLSNHTIEVVPYVGVRYHVCIAT